MCRLRSVADELPDRRRHGNSRGNTSLSALCIPSVPSILAFLSVQVVHSGRRIYALLIRRFRVRAPDAPLGVTCGFTACDRYCLDDFANEKVRYFESLLAQVSQHHARNHRQLRRFSHHRA